ncbi:MAG: TrmH family RNA methyltransferase [Acidimicrobiales bacterium]
MEPLSPRNPRVRAVRRLGRQASERRAEGAFVIEGPGLTTDALDAGLVVSRLFFTWDAPGALLERARDEGIELYEVTPAALESMSTTVTPQPVISVAGIPSQGPETAITAHLLVLDGIQDPGNVGTILRSAEASGAEKIVLTGNSVDVYSPKVVRSSAGAVFRAPVEVSDASISDTVEQLADGSRLALGATADGATDYDQIDLTEAILVMGNEANGLDTTTLDILDSTVAIPQCGDLDSLNVAMAATVLCFEAARQRRQAR